MAWDHGKTTTERGLGWQWQKRRLQALKRDSHLCQPCEDNGRTTAATQVDHIVPRSKGGTDDMANLQAICAECHDAKTATDEGRRVRRRTGLDGWPA